ncbi:MAG: hypothetical protein Q8O31_03385 [Rhodocyclaceae bacterium]|nr:hypothetical protein [Rhodocyclaceae bacterium]
MKSAQSDEVALLREEIAHMNSASIHLRVSVERCAEISESEEDVNLETQERLEALSSRFARLADILTQRVMRLIDEIELSPGETLLDRIFQAEKRGWVTHADQLIRIRKLRNTIAHDYAAENRVTIYAEIQELSPELLTIVSKVISYAESLSKRFL